MGAYNRIAAYGIELEGAWDYEPSGAVHDGSIEGCDLEEVGYMGELPSPPLYSLDATAKWIRSYFYNATNETCGMHVHMSFKNLADYALMMDGKAFQDFLMENLYTWAQRNLGSDHPIFPRLGGDNPMCELNYIPDDQIDKTEKGNERYNVLNFCYALHTTLEIRVLPSFETSDEAVGAVTYLSELVNTWLKGKRKRKLKKTRLDLVMPNKHRERETSIVHPGGYPYNTRTFTIKEESEVR